mgnify:CR=1 FL=1
MPIFIQLTNQWKREPEIALRMLIPTVLAVSLGGYANVIPYNLEFTGEPFDELYIRHLQATAFMPRMSIASTQWDVTPKCREETAKYILLNAKYADVFAKLALERIKTGRPIIRPLWYAEPDNNVTYDISDQYMLGDEFVVAPVLIQGQRERSVYLPAGTFVDSIGQIFEGPNWFKLQAPLDTLLYFRRTNKQ